MTHYVENVGKDDVIFIEVLQADHFSGTFKLHPLIFKKTLTDDRCVGWPMGRANPASNRDGYIELDEHDRLPVQEREAVYSPRHCSGLAANFYAHLLRA